MGKDEQTSKIFFFFQRVLNGNLHRLRHVSKTREQNKKKNLKKSMNRKRRPQKVAENPSTTLLYSN